MVSQKSLKVIIFDFDGTVHDLSIDWAGVRSALQLEEAETIGEAVRRFKELDDKRALSILDELEIEALAGERLSPVVERQISLLHAKYLVAVCSNNSRKAIRSFLESSEVHVDALVGREDVRHLKPDPEGLNMILEQLSLEPTEAVMVGNSVHDSSAARAAGIPSITISASFDRRGAEDVVASMSDLEEAIERRSLIP